MKDELKELLTVATTGKGVVDGIQLNHSAWPEVLYITSVHPGFSAVHEDGQEYDYQYIPMSVKKANKQNDLSQDYSFTIQDLNEVVGVYLDLIPLETDEKVSVILRTFVYREDSSVSDIQDGPYTLEAGDITTTSQGCTFTASPPITNFAGTGEIFTFERFPSLLAYAI
ncbi:hypothetical protein OE855_002626 [Salmonella enterica subsp. enterica serovar Schwarzengrund]|nr:hypothetical protein [Salmonella enterica subsp. enterica serovar 4,[5],12:i:-]EJY0635085.1 hypothetical protein [Salmonella enterica subsp. enterica serovar Schwarzengrund]